MCSSEQCEEEVRSTRAIYLFVEGNTLYYTEVLRTSVLRSPSMFFGHRCIYLLLPAPDGEKGSTSTN